MKTINATTLRQKIINKEDILLVDVRETCEHEAFNIGGLHIPMNIIFKQQHIIPTDKPVVFYCYKGIRSGLVIQRLQQKYPYKNLINLSGGMHHWMKAFK